MAVALRRSRPVMIGERSTRYTAALPGGIGSLRWKQLRARRQHAAVRGQRRSLPRDKDWRPRRAAIRVARRPESPTWRAFGSPSPGSSTIISLSALAIGRDERLGQSQRVDAPPNRFLRLRHGLLLDGGDRGGLHGQRVSRRFAGGRRKGPISGKFEPTRSRNADCDSGARLCTRICVSLTLRISS